jgi:hypothetical protein
VLFYMKPVGREHFSLVTVTGGSMVISGCPEEFDRLQVGTIRRRPQNKVSSVLECFLHFALKTFWFHLLEVVDISHLQLLCICHAWLVGSGGAGLFLCIERYLDPCYEKDKVLVFAMGSGEEDVETW